jgi:hypothetical protein
MEEKIEKLEYIINDVLEFINEHEMIDSIDREELIMILEQIEDLKG